MAGATGGTGVRVAIAGVGNCACSLVQGVRYYRDAPADVAAPGLMTPVLGGYHVADVTFCAAFDVAAGKVGRDLSDAVFAPPNNTLRFADVPPVAVTVRRGPTLDGIGRYLTGVVAESDAPPADVAAVLAESRADVLVSYLPVGSERATRWYAEQALKAGCAFVNCAPVFIASDPAWARRFLDRGLPVIGDDVKSQLGATIVHRALAALFRDRGMELLRTYQLNVGGNTDFLNMLERERLQSKKLSKTRAVTGALGREMPARDCHIGPSDHVPWLDDRKVCHIRMEGTGFGGAPLALDLKLEVWDSPNSAGVVIDAVRCAKLALDRGIGGPLEGPSAWFMKSPPAEFTDEEALRRTARFVQSGDPC